MRFKRLLALLLAAALALSLLAGCGGGESVASALLKLLDGKYPNISIEIDPDLEADLRQAISQAEAENAGDDDAAIRAALEKLVGSTVTFRNLGDGQQGDTTFDLVFYAGTDPDKAAQAAYSQWSSTFSTLPDDGKYGTGLAMVETENGIWMLVKATVEKAGTEDKPDPVTLKSIDVTQDPTKMTYISGESFDPAGMTITATYSDGTTKLVTSDYTYSTEPLTEDNAVVTISYGVQSTTVKVTILDGNNSYDAETRTYSIATTDGLLAWNEAARKDLSFNCTLTANIDLKDKAWTPIGDGSTSANSYQGTFDGQGCSIKGLNASSLFGGIGESATVKNLQLVDVKLNESTGATAGIVVNNYGTIMACSMTGEISAFSYTSGIANFNSGKIVACWFSGTLKEKEGYGIVAYNQGTITACYWGGNAGQGVYSNQGGTVDATKVEGTTTWQNAVDGMNADLTGNAYQWTSGTDGLPTLKKQ